MKNKNDIAIIIDSKKNEILVDEELYYDLILYTWYIDTEGYVRGNVDNKVLRLHRHVMKCTDPKICVDHINNNPLDNRRINLRMVTRHQNSMNKSSRTNSTSKYIGVMFQKNYKNWVSSIRHNGKSLHLGTFGTEIDAARARDKATLQYFGEHGKLNFPKSPEDITN